MRALTTISYVPRAYIYNPNGICGSTAAAIFLMYYNDHVNDNYNLLMNQVIQEKKLLNI